MEFIRLKGLPPLRDPVMLVGFDGWPNAGRQATGTVKYLARALKSFTVAEVDMEEFLVFGESRPRVTVEHGLLSKMVKPRGFFWAARVQGGPPDIVFFHAPEPELKWHTFSKAIFKMVELADVRMMVLLGGMHDHIHHTDTITSGVASDVKLLKTLTDLGIRPIDYEGPGAFHGVLMAEGVRAGLPCLSIWSHTPAYLQGKYYPGIIRLIEHLNTVLRIDVEPADLRDAAREQAVQLDKLIEENKDLKSLTETLSKIKDKKEHLH